MGRREGAQEAARDPRAGYVCVHPTRGGTEHHSALPFKLCLSGALGTQKLWLQLALRGLREVTGGMGAFSQVGLVSHQLCDIKRGLDHLAYHFCLPFSGLQRGLSGTPI